MRRSKSDPAKYARNYRKISQRRMTRYDEVDEEKEIKRLKGILQTSQKHLEQVEESSSSTTKTNENRNRKRMITDLHASVVGNILSDELLLESSHTDKNPLAILPKKKRLKKKSPEVYLSPDEIRDARHLQKKTAKKLELLEIRASKQKKRAKLYKRLQEDQKSQAALQPLLLKSGKLSRKKTDTKKQTLKKILNRERAGISLTSSEEKLLYTERRVVSEPSIDTEFSDRIDVDKNKVDSVKDYQYNNTSDQSNFKNSNHSDEGKLHNGIDFAAMMMASVTKIKNENNEKEKSHTSKVNKSQKLDSLEQKEKYIPLNPSILKTAAAMGLEAPIDLKQNVTSTNIKRPAEVEKSRVDLPVTAMEFEIMESIKSHDVTIICGETGSGKSTQVPAYLYESGMSLAPQEANKSLLIGVTQPRRVAAVSTAKRVCFELGQGDGLSIKGSGKKGNLVAYKTRYESAGSGDATHIQFMTDGILLNEIQKDLLLRKYNVIVLDESHERNLNTDVLIGLLSVALPLRKKAALEDSSIVPLKLVLMSATLRVEDFSKNEKLFPTGQPSIVTVPGRTHPVTIHHSKKTELDDYETVAFQKICKIHHQLPHGGILVFLTGKDEIIRMMKRLKRALGDSKKESDFKGTDHVVISESHLDVTNTPREMDDEELDAEDNSFDDYDNFGDCDNKDEDFEENFDVDPNCQSDGVPKHAYILPLYSLLSSNEQGKVFSPAPDNHRLIVLATNIAETSITIPGVSYVVDTGRQKCRNYNSGTGVASYDIMWISKASASQRAGRAGRTGPGHCYRLYSSSLFSRHMDDFAIPEVLSRPLEDIVLAMKAMNISNVSSFPFPTRKFPSSSYVRSYLIILLYCNTNLRN